MEIRSNEDGWVFDEIDPLIADLLRILPASASVEDDAARSRIFSAPTAGEDKEADDDWHEYVEPELRELFQSHTDTVAADLSAMKSDADTCSLSIPAGHGRAWIHTLNQARLALGARHGVTESDSKGRRRHSGEKSFALMQIDFYGMLIGLLLGRTEL